jgi:protein gp37
VTARRTPDYTTASWNVVLGCSPVGPGCDNCVGANAVHRFGRHPDPRIAVPMAGLTTPERRGTWTGKVSHYWSRLDEPTRWVKPRRVAVAPLGDLFHEAVEDAFLIDAFRTMHQAGRHAFFVLTKHPRRMAEFSRSLCFDERADDVYRAGVGGRPYLPLAPHVFVGTSVEDQQRADERIPELLRAEAARRWVAVEPMLGPVDLRDRLIDAYRWDFLAGERRGTITRDIVTEPRFHFVVCGGETGPSARPFDVAWVRALRDQCRAAGVPFWFRGGARPARGSVLLDAVPADLVVQELPLEARDGTQV